MASRSGRKANTTQRGLGYAHRKAVENLLLRHKDGSPCYWCGRPMWKDRTRNWDYDPSSPHAFSGSLSGDHSLPRSLGGKTPDRLLHLLCNGQRGEGARDHMRPALTGRVPTEPIGDTTSLGVRLMPWPN